MPNKEFNKDVTFSNICEEYISESEIFKKKFKSLKRIKYEDDPDAQKKGVDLFIVTKENKLIRSDIKSIATYNLPTFCIELSSYDDKDTWFNREGIVTDTLILSYVEVKNGSGNYKKDKKIIKSKEDIKRMKLFIINEAELKKALNKGLAYFGKDISKLRDDIISAKNKGLFTKNSITSYYYNREGKIVTISDKQKSKLTVWFTYSDQKTEKPINIVIRRSYYLSLPKTISLDI